MKYLLTKVFCLIVFAWVLSPSIHLFAQKSSAELIATIRPPELANNVQVNDGARHITIFDNQLLVSNYWTGLRLFDISDVANPVQKAFVQMEDEVYNSMMDGKYIYLSNDAGGVQIFEPDNLKKISQIKTPGGAHWVYGEYPYIYVALGDEGFCVMDLSDLNNPITRALEVPAEWVQQLTKNGNLLFVAAKKGGMIIYDVSQVDDPQKLSQFKTEYDVMSIQVLDNMAYIADGPGGLLILDISNPKLPIEVSRFTKDGFVSDVHKVGNYAYLANQNVGLQIVNVTDPSSPFLEGKYDAVIDNYSVFKKDIYVFLAANAATLIMRHNNRPQLEDIPDLTLREGETFQLTLNASEPDGDPIVKEAFNLPEGSTFDSATGQYAWIPTYDQSGVYKNVIFKVTEQTQSMLSVADTLTVTVEHVNRLPDLPSLADRTIDEDSTLTFEIPEGSDPDKEDQQRLRYLAENLPQGASFDSAARAFSWTPTYAQSGMYIIDFLLDDGGGGIDREPMTITVNHIDRKPEIDPVTDKEIDEDQTLTIALSGSDPDEEDQDRISFVIENLPDGAVFDAEAQTFSWTPTFDQSGNYPDINAIMIAGNMSDTSTFSITVNHVNRPPVMAEIGDKAVNENEELAFALNVSDPDVEDAGKLQVSAETLPMGATFDTSSYQFSWIPTFEQSRTYSGIGFTVSDPAGLSNRQEISITVNHVNRPPAIEDVPDQFVNENESIEIQLVADDPDAEDKDNLVFSIDQLPDGAKLDFQNGLFDWTPTFEQSGTYDIFFFISDGDYSDSTFTRITVENVNRPPELTDIANQTVDENQAVSLEISGSDPDSEDAGALTYTAMNLPAGAVFDAGNLTFQWTPTYDQSGEYQITFEVEDAAGLTAQDIVSVTVNHINRPPALEAIEDQIVDENQLLTIQLNGTDPDSEDIGKLVFQVNNLPRGANLDQAAGTITWTPTFDQAGDYPLMVSIADASGLQAEQSFKITVNNINRPPVFEEIAAQSGKENSSVTFTLTVTDPDRDDVGKLNYTATNLPEGATLSSSTGNFFWTPTYEQSGNYQVDFQVTDSHSASDNTQVSIVVENVNRPPFIEGLDQKTVDENERLDFVITGKDPDIEDEGKVRLRSLTLPTGASFDAGSGQFSWTPNYDQSGRYVVEFQATDDQAASVEETVIVEVQNVNRAPKIESPGNKNIKELETLSFRLTASDPDKEDQGNLKFSGENLPKGAQLRPNGEFTWTPGIDQQGSYDITLKVTDIGDMSDSVTISVTVEDGAGLPEGQ